jgi:cyclopropane-fatty-acyl-phospholipid synthase
MIYKFKSQASADVIMLQINAEQMLTIIGKEPSPQGIVTVEQIPAAIAALESAVAAHGASQSTGNTAATAQVEVAGDGVMLRQRAAPFIELLRSSAEAGKNVVWGI